jgi:hypothetical protein
VSAYISELNVATRKAADGDDKGALCNLGRAKASWDIDCLEVIAGLAEDIRDRNEGKIRRRAESLLAELKFDRSRIATRTFKRVATIDFPTVGHANVMLESSPEVPAERVVREAETLLFGLLAARQIANLDDEESSQMIGQTLLGFSSGPAALLELLEVGGPGDLRITNEVGRLKTGFRATLKYPWEISRFGTLHDLLARIGFDLEVRGFPASGQGLGWFAPMSAIALLFVFARRRATDEDFLWRLAYVAGTLGARAAMEDINVLNQAKPALIATVDAWTPEDPTDLWAEPEESEEPDEGAATTPGISPAVENEDPEAGEDSALRIVRERYAQGEISREEFLELVADLSE